MAAPTKSTLNSKLPKVSKIAFCTSAGKGMATKIYTGENGKFTRMVGFKQESKTYPYQIQFRSHSRYTKEYERIRGAAWTAWGSWKNAVGVTNIPFESTEAAKPVDRWMKANKGINTNGTYQTFLTFTDHQLPSNCDMREWQFRIRTFNKSQARHGLWTVQTLTVCKRAAVANENPIIRTDGGVKIKFNYISDRYKSVQVDSVMDSAGRELLRKPFYATVEVAHLSANTTPTPRTGYQPGLVNIPLSALKRKVTAGESLSASKIYFRTDQDALTRFSLGNVLDPRRDIDMSITPTWNESLGILTVAVANNDEVALSSVGCSVSYTYNGKSYSISPYSSTINLASGGYSYFRFFPPIGLQLTIHVSEEDVDDYKDWETATYTPTAKGYRLNKLDSYGTCGVAWGNPSWDMTSQPQMETALPYGREKNVAFYGKGNTTAINLSALIVDKANLYGGDYGRKKAWDTIRNNQGIYVFRTPKGDMYKVALTNVSITHDTKDLYNLNVSMTEVV